MTDRRSSGQMFSLIESWESSGLTQAQFCQDHDLRMGTFAYWRKKHIASRTVHESSNLEKVDSGFVPIRVSSIDSGVKQQPLLELSMGSASLYFYQLPSVEWLQKLLS